MLSLKNFSCNGELLKTYQDCYFIHFEYEKESSAQEFFTKVAEYIQVFDVFTNQLVKPFGMGIEINLEIQNLENGSLRVWLKDVLERINDDTISRYINNPKEPIIDFVKFLKGKILKALQENQHDQILPIHEQAFKNSPIAKELGYKINENSFLESVSALSTKSLAFSKPPSIHIEDCTYTITTKLPYNIREHCETQNFTTKGIFLIKKPDLQGDSQWEIISDKTIKVKYAMKLF